MARNTELLLLETVENLGIVGDVVKVKSGYARNYLLPHGVAEPPTPTKVEALKEQRAKAQTELAAARSHREKVIEDLGIVLDDILLVGPGRLPKTSSGKRRHRHFRDLYLQGRLEHVSSSGG